MGTAYKWGAQCIPHDNSSLNYQDRQKEFPSHLPQRTSPDYVIQNIGIFLILRFVCVNGCRQAHVGSDLTRPKWAAGTWCVSSALTPSLAAGAVIAYPHPDSLPPAWSAPVGPCYFSRTAAEPQQSAPGRSALQKMLCRCCCTWEVIPAREARLNSSFQIWLLSVFH